MKRKKIFFRYGAFTVMLFLILAFVLLANGNWTKLWSYKNTASSDDSEASTETSPASGTTTAATETKSATTTTAKPIPNDADYVKVVDYIPTIYVELKYATDDNITGHAIYDFTDAYLRYGTVKKLIPVQDELIRQGYCLKIWDAYRPAEAQFELWKAKPNAKYIANPNNGYTSHSLGNTLDVTLVTVDGADIDMPTGFDNFTSKADRNYSDVTDTQAGHALLLENLMKDNGFKPYSGEWWHFQDTKAYTYDENFHP